LQAEKSHFYNLGIWYTLYTRMPATVSAMETPRGHGHEASRKK